MNKKLLVVGTIQPPIGGVTTHVSRLLENLKNSKISFEFFDYKTKNKKKLFGAVSRSKLIHIQTSNSAFRLILILFCRILRKKSIFTFHGDLGRYGEFRNFLDRVSILLADVPILINEKSFIKAQKINSKSKFLSAFFLPNIVEQLPLQLIHKINIVKHNTNILYCTNASNLAFDKNQNEIYRILDLVNLFKENPENGLIISDPSGNYNKYFNQSKIVIPKNILIIPFIHDFNSILKLSDCFIRFTFTDGDSLSIREAISLGIPVITTNVVERPLQTIIIENKVECMREAISEFRPRKIERISKDDFNALEDLYYKMIV